MATVRDLIRVLRGFKGSAPVSYCEINIDTKTVDLVFQIRLSGSGGPEFSEDEFEVDADGLILPEPILVSNVINFERKD